MNFGIVISSAGATALLSFCFLAAAIGSDYWYIIEVDKANCTHSEDLDSHSGLWRIYEGMDLTSLIDLHKVVVVLLPLTLVLLVFGWICGLVSSLARSKSLLSGTASYFLLCSLLTLSGVSVYISYSQQALEELERLIGTEQLAHVHVSYGWSLGVAWLAFSLQVATGLLLFLASRMTHVDHGGVPSPAAGSLT
uniref:Transmembrane protein 235 n=1 Tax=Scleropages formosus TaxID=113540 RepID=A0A8C9VY84_SCLFO